MSMIVGEREGEGERDSVGDIFCLRSDAASFSGEMQILAGHSLIMTHLIMGNVSDVPVLSSCDVGRKG